MHRYLPLLAFLSVIAARADGDCADCRQAAIVQIPDITALATDSLLKKSCDEMPSDRITFDSTPGERTHWKHTQAAPKKGVAIVVHGINLLPSKMGSISEVLRSEGYDVLQVALRGHRGDVEEFKKVERDEWLEDVLTSYCGAKKAAKDQNLPVIYAGFSLGGLLGQRLLNADLKEKASFKQMLLFSPAIRTKGAAKLYKPFEHFGPDFITPNPQPRSYSANKAGVPVKGYQVLEEHIEALKQEGHSRSNEVPTAVFIDPRDEVVDKDAIVKDVMASNRLNNWNMIPVKASGKVFPILRHLVLDEATLGKKAWKEISDHIRARIQ